MRGEPGFFDVDDRLRRLSDLGDQLEAFGSAVDFEIFRADLDEALGYRIGPQGGRPPFDPVLMFKILVIQSANNLSDERAEFLINDRLSFMRFLGLGLSDRVPDARTIWLFREKLTKAGAIRGLFGRFDAVLRSAGYIAMSGQIIDASLVAAPKQRNTEDEKKAIKEGRVPEHWKAPPRQAPPEGPGRALDGEVQQGQGAARRLETARRHRHPRLRLPEPYRHRPGLRSDPDLDGDGRRRLRGRASAGGIAGPEEHGCRRLGGQRLSVGRERGALGPQRLREPHSPQEAAAQAHAEEDPSGQR